MRFLNREKLFMTLDDSWFSEPFESCGTAFSLKIKAKLHEEQSPYQKIAIYDTEPFGKLMTIDGCVMLTTRDNFLYHEMMSHPALFTHPNPQNVVIIGGGDCGTLKEVLKHQSVTNAIQVDIDERVTKLSEIHFPELCISNNDPRAKLLFVDGVQWMKETPEQSVDVIIVDSTDPVGFAEGLFQVPFFKDCLRVLKDGGIIVQQSESPLLHGENIIKNLHLTMKEAGFVDTQTIPFPQPVYPSGWWSATMARKNSAIPQFRETEAREKAFETQYYNADLHKGSLALPTFLKNILTR